MNHIKGETDGRQDGTSASESSYDVKPLRDTAKWIAVSAGTIATAAIAGLQLTQLPGSAGAAAVAAVGFVLLIGAALWILVRTAAVLVSRVTSLADLNTLRQTVDGDENHKLHGVKAADQLAWVDAEIPTLTFRLADDFPGLWRRTREIDFRRNTLLGQEPPQDVSGDYERLGNADLEKLGDRLDHASENVVAAATWRLVEAQYQKLIRHVVIAGAVAAVGVLLFAGAVAFADTPNKPLAVEEPTAVIVHIKDPMSIEGLVVGAEASACESVEGFVVGGSWPKPEIVTESTEACAAVHIDDDAGVQVVPNPEADDGPSDGTAVAGAITTPTEVTVYLVSDLATDAADRLGPLDCWTRGRKGVAVNGTWLEPVVVVPQADLCPAVRLAAEDGERFIVVPVTPDRTSQDG